jgi:DNA-binding Lrp family transcriptional regulator
MESRIEMSQHERDVLKIMSSVLQGERTRREAARLLRLSERQVRRIQRRLENDGDGGVVHRLRGRPSNRQLNEPLRQQALAI